MAIPTAVFPRVAFLFALLLAVAACREGAASRAESAGPPASVELLNVSYDPTRELYDAFNAAFVEHWRAETGQTVRIRMSHGGAGKQARAVLGGLEADVVTLNVPYDIDMLHERGGLLPSEWQSRLAHGSAPYTSTIVFLVREGNPKNVRDWDDLLRPGIAVVTPNPKTSGGARWNYLAAWGYALKRAAGAADAEAHAQEFVTRLYRKVPVLDSGARGSTNTFVQRGIGDVLLAWENDAFLTVEELGPDRFDVVVPSISIRATAPVAWLDRNVDKHGTAEVARAYLEYLYSPEGQRIVAQHYYRPAYPQHADSADLARFADVEMFTVEEVFGSWTAVQEKHFDDGGTFDRIYRPGN